MWVEKVASDLWEKISKSERVAFLATFVSGILAHLYIWTNTIPNFDGMSRVYDEQQVTLLGRWFIHYTSALHDYTQMPMMIGVLAMFFLALTAMVVVRLFGIRSSIYSGIWGVIAAVFPVVAYTSTYTFTVVEYCLAALLAVSSVYFVRKHKVWGWIVGCILLTLTMGIYQAYVCVAITLSVLLIIFDMLDEHISFVKAVKNGFVHVFYIGVSAGLYYIILQVFLKIKDIKMSTYLGMNMVADGYPLDMLGSILLSIYKQVYAFFFVAEINNSFSDRWLVFVHVCIFLITLILFAICIYRSEKKQRILCTLGAVLLLSLVPLAMNFSQIISPYSTPTPIMKYAFVFFYLLPIILLGLLGEKQEENQTNAIVVEKKSVLEFFGVKKGILELILLFSMSSAIFYYWKYDNVLYNMLNQTHRATLSFVTNVVGRIESCEGYEYGMEVVIVGGFPSDRYYAEVENYPMVQQGGATSTSVIPLNKHIYYYMGDWLNVPMKEPAEEVFINIANSEEFLSMPLYPNDGSVKIIDNYVVVKMQQTFTPRAQYEKDYENRR